METWEERVEQKLERFETLLNIVGFLASAAVGFIVGRYILPLVFG